MIHDPERVAAIRKRVEAGLAHLQEMEVVKDEEFRRWLSLTRNWFNDIEPTYLKNLSDEKRNPEEESIWLSGVELSLRITEQQCLRLCDAFKTYGPDLRFMV